MKPTVLWLSDCKKWAFDIRIKQLKESLVLFTHKTLYLQEDIGVSEFIDDVAKADVIVIPMPLLRHVEQYIEDKSKIIILLSSIRSIE